MGMPGMPPTIRALIFDMDGLLVDGETMADIALTELFRRYGREFHPDDPAIAPVWGLVGQKMIVVLAALAEVYGLDVSPEQLLQELDDLRVEKIIPEPLQAMPGAAEILAFGKAEGLPMALATSGERRYADACLKATSLTGSFAAEVTGDQVSRGKPDPETFLLAAQRLGVDPAHCAVFEDAPAGIAAAVAGGMRAVAVPNIYTRTMDFPVPPEVSVPDLFAAIAWLREQGRE